MKVLKKCLVGLFAGIVLLSVGFGGSHEPFYRVLPFVKNEGKYLCLMVRIPDNFDQHVGRGMTLYIPTTDKDSYTWSELLMLTSSKKYKDQASYMADELKERVQLMDKDVKVKVMHYSATEEDQYTVASIAMMYRNKQKRQEMSYAIFYSGSLGCVAVHYVVPVEDVPDGEKDAWNRVNDFINDPKNVTLEWHGKELESVYKSLRDM